MRPGRRSWGRLRPSVWRGQWGFRCHLAPSYCFCAHTHHAHEACLLCVRVLSWCQSVPDLSSCQIAHNTLTSTLTCTFKYSRNIFQMSLVLTAKVLNVMSFSMGLMFSFPPLREALLAEMGVAIREDGGTLGVFSPKKVQLFIINHVTVCTSHLLLMSGPVFLRISSSIILLPFLFSFIFCFARLLQWTPISLVLIDQRHCLLRTLVFILLIRFVEFKSIFF